MLGPIAVLWLFALPVGAGDYDADDDGLIEIGNARQLDAVRFDWNGDGQPDATAGSAWALAFPGAHAGMGCPAGGCAGYELVADIDLGIAPWNEGAGWTPVGDRGRPWSAILDGNGHSIVNLLIDRPEAAGVGLFGALGLAGEIRSVRLIGASVRGLLGVGALVGENSGRVVATYASGAVTADRLVGGLVGQNLGGVVNACRGDVAVVASAAASSRAGGLVGWNRDDGLINASLSLGRVDSRAVDGIGGLVGVAEGRVAASYFDLGRTAQVHAERGRTSAQLTSDASLYTGWNDVDVDLDGVVDRPWTFRPGSYPTLAGAGADNEPAGPDGGGGGGGPPPSDDRVDDGDDDEGGDGGCSAPPLAAIAVDADCAGGLCRARTGVPVRFEDVSSCSARIRRWDFGDGRIRSSGVLSHSWSEPGFHDVTLWTSDGSQESTASRASLVEAREPAGTCEPDDGTLCLQDSRFAVDVRWRRRSGSGGLGRVVRSGTNDSGMFRFFDRDNWEVLVKVLDGCAVNGHVWVYAALTTDLGYTIRVKDTATGTVREYGNDVGTPGLAVADATAFPGGCDADH